MWQASRTKRWLDVSSRNDRFLTCLRFLNVNRYTPKGLNCSTLQLSPEPIAIICLIWGRDLRRHRCFRHHAKPWKPSESYSFTGAACCFAVGIHTKLTDMQTWWMRAVENIDMQSQRVWKPQQQLQHLLILAQMRWENDSVPQLINAGKTMEEKSFNSPNNAFCGSPPKGRS